jgi:hypothetical protein
MADPQSWSTYVNQRAEQLSRTLPSGLATRWQVRVTSRKGWDTTRSLSAATPMRATRPDSPSARLRERRCGSYASTRRRRPIATAATDRGINNIRRRPTQSVASAAVAIVIPRPREVVMPSSCPKAARVPRGCEPAQFRRPGRAGGVRQFWRTSRLWARHVLRSRTMSRRCGCPADCWCRRRGLRLIRGVIPRSGHRRVHPDVKRRRANHLWV